MIFDKESISEDFFLFGGGSGAWVGRLPTKKIKYNSYLLIFCAHALYKISSSWLIISGSLVLTQTKGVTDRKDT